jgi:hypothetical protein
LPYGRWNRANNTIETMAEMAMAKTRIQAAALRSRACSRSRAGLELVGLFEDDIEPF